MLEIFWACRKQADLGNRTCLRKSIDDRIPQLCELLQNLVHPCYVLLLQLHQKLGLRPARIHYVHALFSWELWNVGYRILLPGMRRFFLSVRVIVHAFNCFREQWPLFPKLISLFYNKGMVQPLAWRALLIMSRSTSMEKRCSLHLIHLLLPFFTSTFLHHQKLFLFGRQRQLSPPCGKRKRRTEHTVMNTRLDRLLCNVAEVIYVTWSEYVVACALQLALTSHTLRKLVRHQV